MCSVSSEPFRQKQKISGGNLLMNIAIITNTRPHEGGVTTYINNITVILRELGCDVDVITVFGCSKKRNVKPDFVLFTDRILRGSGLKAAVAYVLSSWMLWIRLIFKTHNKKYDIFYALDVSAANVVIFLGPSYRQKLFLRVGASMSLDLLAQNKFQKDSRYHRLFLRQELRAYCYARKIIPNSSWTAQYVKTIFSNGNISDPLYSPIDASTFQRHHHERHKVRNSWGVCEDDFVILFPGRLDYRKGAHILIEALDLLVKKNLRYKVVILGVGPEEQHLKELIASKRLQKHIMMMGVIPFQRMPFVYSGADCFVLPAIPIYLAEEAMPHSALEAMASGLPVIASAIGGLRDFITHGRDGLLVNPGDASEIAKSIEDLSHDKMRCELIGNEARSTIIKYCSGESVGKKLVELFAENTHGIE